MISASEWTPNQPNTIRFTLVNEGGVEVPGLGSGFTVQLCKPGSTVFAVGAGTRRELGLGAYEYVADASEADTAGPVMVIITGSGIIQQNLEYVVQARVVGAVEFTYTLTDSVTGYPIEGATVWFAIDSNGNKVVWIGATDASGVARDIYGNRPMLTPGTYYVRAMRRNYVFPVDTEVVV